MNKEKLIDLEEIKKIEMQIMEKVDSICKEHNIKYTLMAGSAIGAVRHHGFIPWDDDIDIMMLREDYNKLKEIFENNEYEDLKYMSCETQQDFPYPFAKVISTKTSAKEIGIKKPKDYGLFIDIFPVDKVPENEIERNRFLNKVRFWYKLYFVKIYEHQISTNKLKLFVKRAISLILKPISLRKVVLKLDNLSKENNNKESYLYAVICDNNTLNKKIVYPREMYSNVSDVDFENKKILLMDEYNEYLTNEFGDYMKLPPEEKRKTNHNWEYIKMI